MTKRTANNILFYTYVTVAVLAIIQGFLAIVGGVIVWFINMMQDASLQTALITSGIFMLAIGIFIGVLSGKFAEEVEREEHQDNGKREQADDRSGSRQEPGAVGEQEIDYHRV